MATEESKALVSYLVGASRLGLGAFMLDRRNRAANLERDLRERLHALVEVLAEAYLADFLREHGEELAEYLGSPRRRRK